MPYWRVRLDDEDVAPGAGGDANIGVGPSLEVTLDLFRVGGLAPVLPVAVFLGLVTLFLPWDTGKTSSNRVRRRREPLRAKIGGRSWLDLLEFEQLVHAAAVRGASFAQAGFRLFQRLVEADRRE